MSETERPARPPGRDRQQPPPPVTAERLERAALLYLERFSASAASLRRVLARRVERSARDHGSDPAEGAGWIEALILRYRQSGLLDDAVYAEAKAGSLRRRGASARAIRDRLAAKGVDTGIAAAALARTDQDSGHAESAEDTAALALARRRRLGPFRPEARRAEQRSRDLAALGRAGFSYETARRVIDAKFEPEEP
ncbi:MAG: RecX family transcriptional regulator [Rhodospirillaceae bacterium]